MPKELQISKIKGLMAEKGITQTTLAHQLNINRVTLSYKFNRKKKFKENEIGQIAATLGKDVGYFYE